MGKDAIKVLISSRLANQVDYDTYRLFVLLMGNLNFDTPVVVNKESLVPKLRLPIRSIENCFKDLVTVGAIEEVQENRFILKEVFSSVY